MKHTETHPEVFFTPEGPLVAVIAYNGPGQEPGDCCVYGNEGYQFSRVVAQKCRHEDAKRIAACLNYCRGMSIEELEPK